MADKKFIVKNGLTTQNISFVDNISNVSNTITASMSDNDKLSFSGDNGEIISITDNLSGNIFSIKDSTSSPILEVDSDNTIRLSQNSGNVLIGTATDDTTNKLQVNGSIKSIGLTTTDDINMNNNYITQLLDPVNDSDAATKNYVDEVISEFPPAEIVTQRLTYIAESNQTTFNVSYDVGYVEFYLNGVKLIDSVNFTATNGTTIVLSEPASENDIIEIIAYGIFVLSDHYSKTQSDSRYLQITNNLSDVDNAATARTNLGFDQGVSTTDSPSFSGLNVNLSQGDIIFENLDDEFNSTDAGIVFNGSGLIRSAIFTEVDGEILSYGINTHQIDSSYDQARSGAIFRLDTRTSGATGDSNCFVIKARSAGEETPFNGLIIDTNSGDTMLSPFKGNVGVGTTSPTEKLDVNGTVKATTFKMNGWTITESDGSLYFATNGINKMKLDADGNLDVVGSINANATIS